MGAFEILASCLVSLRNVGRINKKIELGKLVFLKNYYNSKGMRKITHRKDRILKKLSEKSQRINRRFNNEVERWWNSD